MACCYAAASFVAGFEFAMNDDPMPIGVATRWGVVTHTSFDVALVVSVAFGLMAVHHVASAFLFKQIRNMHERCVNDWRLFARLVVVAMLAPAILVAAGSVDAPSVVFITVSTAAAGFFELQHVRLSRTNRSWSAIFIFSCPWAICVATAAFAVGLVVDSHETGEMHGCDLALAATVVHFGFAVESFAFSVAPTICLGQQPVIREGLFARIETTSVWVDLVRDVCVGMLVVSSVRSGCP